MQQIEIYLEKFKDFGLKDKLFKQEISKIIKEEVNVDLKEEDVSMINGTIRINVSGSAKSEIFIKKKSIQNKLEKRFDIL
ncbi:hypothetical protein N9L18_00065 [Candidatus Pacebacteria bacterium]|nr:hypothetical protein [Candidatus Paceibacterota bacterium]